MEVTGRYIKTREYMKIVDNISELANTLFGIEVRNRNLFHEIILSMDSAKL